MFIWIGKTYLHCCRTNVAPNHPVPAGATQAELDAMLANGTVRKATAEEVKEFGGDKTVTTKPAKTSEQSFNTEALMKLTKPVLIELVEKLEKEKAIKDVTTSRIEKAGQFDLTDKKVTKKVIVEYVQHLNSLKVVAGE